MGGRGDASRFGAPALAAIVVLFAAWLLYPVPWAGMPMSADHTVHLARIAMTGRRLFELGQVSGWDPTWFFGFPLGELYPPLGDLIVIALRVSSFGLLDWPRAYGLGFFLVFVGQGLALLRVSRLVGLGRGPGLIAALLLLGDPGFTREGGWLYTVYFGVWPQALATTLLWLGLAECVASLREDAPSLGGFVRAGIAFGAAALAHPIAVPSTVVGLGMLAIMAAPRAAYGWRTAITRLGLAACIGFGVAAWWWLPMLEHSAWMASYGWLYASLEAMTNWLKDGRWAQRMPAAVGYLALVGMLLALIPRRGDIGLRFVAAFALSQWLLASSDAFWLLRLDRFSDGFAHLQWQRFLIVAKPGLYLCVGAVFGLLLGSARALWHESRHRVAALPLALAGAGLGAWLVADQREAMAENRVGEIQTERIPTQQDFDADYHALLAWIDGEGAPVAFRDDRNRHWFMDAPVWTKVPIYKAGFTPGDNFVHKPESARTEVLEALGIRYVVSLGKPRDVPGQVARFGPLVVRERSGQRHPLQIDGEGSFEVLEYEPRAGHVLVRVEHASEGSRAVFSIGAYPRWQATIDGQPVEWIEVPVWGSAPPVTAAQRRAGELRGGKALGDDGSEPTLLAVDLPPGASTIALRYRRWLGVDVRALLISLMTFAGLALAAHRPSRARLAPAVAKLEHHIARTLHWTLGLALIGILLLLGSRWRTSVAEESQRLVGHVHAAKLERARLGPIKTDMLIRPSVLLQPRGGQPATLSLTIERMPARLRGWFALDDDEAKSRGRWARHHIVIEARELGSEGPFSMLVDVQVRHQPGREPIDVESGDLAGRPVELRIIDRPHSNEGARAPQLGIDLDLVEGGTEP